MIYYCLIRATGLPGWRPLNVKYGLNWLNSVLTNGLTAVQGQQTGEASRANKHMVCLDYFNTSESGSIMPFRFFRNLSVSPDAWVYSIARELEKIYQINRVRD